MLSVCAAGLAPHPAEQQRPSVRLQLAALKGPFIGGSIVPLGDSFASGSLFAVVGPGIIDGDRFIAPTNVREPLTTAIVAANVGVSVSQNITIVPTPAPKAPLLAVAGYYGGLGLHRLDSLKLFGTTPIPGAAGDVASGPDGSLYVPATTTHTLWRARRNPWNIAARGNVPLGNEVRVARQTGTVFVTNRDVDGWGGLTQLRGDTVRRIRTGRTAEGLAIDERHNRVYVGNVNDATVLEVDATTLAPLRRIRAVARTFGIALHTRRRLLYVVSNQTSNGGPKQGFAAAIDLSRPGAPIIAKTEKLPFPLGVDVDERTNRLFVTDENANAVYVFDALTLQRRGAALRACGVPWRPHVDALRRRLYVPCALADKLAVFNLDTLLPVRGSPFETVRYPLGVDITP